MRLVHQSESLAVFDDVLESGEMNRLREFQREQEYSFVQTGVWYQTYDLCDGNPLESAAVVSGAVSGAEPGSHYPTGSAVDLFLERLDEVLEREGLPVGRRAEDWLAYSCRSFLYPMGTALGWHDDRDAVANRTGAYTFYTHPQWELSWGGELLIQEPTGLDPRSSSLRNAGLSESIFAQGVGKVVFPRPNRLVLIRQGTWHAIGEVRRAAGDRVRCSLAGFFIGGPRVESAGS